MGCSWRLTDYVRLQKRLKAELDYSVNDRHSFSINPSSVAYAFEASNAIYRIYNNWAL